MASDLAVPAALYPHPAPQRVRAAPLPRGAPEQSLAHLLLPRPPLAPHRSPAPPPAALWLCSESATASRSQAARGGRDACEPSASGGGETQADLARRERNWAQRLKSKERKAAKVANLPAEERYVPSTLKTDQLLFVKPATAPTPAVHRGPQPPQLSNPCAPWGGLPVVIRHIEKNGPPPRPGADPTYLFVESVVPGGPAWRVHRSQALAFRTVVEPRWNRLEAERDEGRAGAASELLELRLGLVHAVAREVVRDARGGNAEARLKQLFPARWRAHAEARKLQPGWKTLPRGLPLLLAELSEEIKQLPTRPGPSSGALSEPRGGAARPSPRARPLLPGAEPFACGAIRRRSGDPTSGEGSKARATPLSSRAQRERAGV